MSILGVILLKVTLKLNENEINLKQKHWYNDL